MAAMPHQHCDWCFRLKCTVTTDPPCTVVSCALFCGAAFHECKSDEHRDLCPLEKVPCINVGNGCPVVRDGFVCLYLLSKSYASDTDKRQKQQ